MRKSGKLDEEEDEVPIHNGNEIDELKKIFYQFLMNEQDGETPALNQPPKYLVKRSAESEFTLYGEQKGGHGAVNAAYSVNRESLMSERGHCQMIKEEDDEEDLEDNKIDELLTASIADDEDMRFRRLDRRGFAPVESFDALTKARGQQAPSPVSKNSYDLKGMQNTVDYKEV